MNNLIFPRFVDAHDLAFSCVADTRDKQTPWRDFRRRDELGAFCDKFAQLQLTINWLANTYFLSLPPVNQFPPDFALQQRTKMKTVVRIFERIDSQMGNESDTLLKDLAVSFGKIAFLMRSCSEAAEEEPEGPRNADSRGVMREQMYRYLSAEVEALQISYMCFLSHMPHFENRYRPIVFSFAAFLLLKQFKGRFEQFFATTVPPEILEIVSHYRATDFERFLMEGVDNPDLVKLDRFLYDSCQARWSCLDQFFVFVKEDGEEAMRLYRHLPEEIANYDDRQIHRALVSVFNAKLFSFYHLFTAPEVFERLPIEVRKVFCQGLVNERRPEAASLFHYLIRYGMEETIEEALHADIPFSADAWWEIDMERVRYGKYRLSRFATVTLQTYDGFSEPDKTSFGRLEVLAHLVQDKLDELVGADLIAQYRETYRLYLYALGEINLLRRTLPLGDPLREPLANLWARLNNDSLFWTLFCDDVI